MSDSLASELSLPLWRKNLTSSLDLHQKQIQSRYFQLATCNIDGQPRVRTVVFRGFVQNSNVLAIHTDIRSEKCAQLLENPLCEINWYFTESREQYRIAGKVCLVTDNSSEYRQYRLWHWQQLSLAAKADYTKSVPGIPLPTKTQMASDSEHINAQQLATPHNNFVLLLLQPNAVDHVMLLPSPHERVMYKYDKNGVWQHNSITP